MVKWTNEKLKELIRLKEESELTYTQIASKMEDVFKERYGDRALQSQYNALINKKKKLYNQLKEELKTGPETKPITKVTPETRSKFYWGYEDIPISVNAVKIHFIDKPPIFYHDTDITVNIERIENTLVPNEALVLINEDIYQFVIGEPVSLPEKGDLEVSEIDIDYMENDEWFKTAGWKSIPKTTKGTQVPAIEIILRTIQKTDLFREDVEHIIFIPGEKNHSLKALNKWTSASVIEVGDRSIFKINDYTTTGSIIATEDIAGQQYIGVIEGMKLLPNKKTAIINREVMENERDERAWDELIPIGFTQKREDIVEYLYIDEEGRVKRTRIVPSKGGR